MQNPDPTTKPDLITMTTRYGTVFSADPALRGDIQITCRPSLPAELFAADCIEFAGIHGVKVHPNLRSFSGYDCVSVKINTTIPKSLGYFARQKVRLFKWLSGLLSGISSIQEK